MDEVRATPMGAEPLAFTVLRVPFFLEPDYSPDEDFSETNRKRLVRKWGGEAGFEAQKSQHRLKERGHEVGIQHFNLDRLASSTLASHRLVQWVTKVHGVNVAEALYAELNFRHFEKGQKLNDRAMLAEAAASFGVDHSAAAAFLASDEGEAEIRAAQKLLVSLGIHSIPTFVIGGERAVSGAVHQRELVEMFRAIEARGGGASKALFAAALGFSEETLAQSLGAAS